MSGSPTWAQSCAFWPCDWSLAPGSSLRSLLLLLGCLRRPSGSPGRRSLASSSQFPAVACGSRHSPTLHPSLQVAVFHGALTFLKPSRFPQPPGFSLALEVSVCLLYVSTVAQKMLSL